MKINENKNEKTSTPKFYDPKGVCDMLHIHRSTLYRHKACGFISPSYYVGSKPLYTPEDIDAYLAKFDVDII